VVAVGFAASLTLHAIQSKLESVAEMVTETDPHSSMTCCGVAPWRNTDGKADKQSTGTGPSGS